MDDSVMAAELVAGLDEPCLKSLGLAGDGDEIDLVRAVEQAFDISLENRELEKCLSVGDLHALTLTQFPDAGDRGGACLAAGAFYRLRRAFRRMYPDAAISFDVSIRTIVGDASARDVWRRLEQESSLQLPPLQIGWTPLGPLLEAFHETPILPTWKAILIGALLPPTFLLSIPIWIVTAFFVRRLPEEAESFADLARSAAWRNVGKLARAAQSYRRAELWRAFVSIIRDQTAVKGHIGETTRLLG